jgi:hypothetical protein
MKHARSGVVLPKNNQLGRQCAESSDNRGGVDCRRFSQPKSLRLDGHLARRPIAIRDLEVSSVLGCLRQQCLRPTGFREISP